MFSPLACFIHRVPPSEQADVRALHAERWGRRFGWRRSGAVLGADACHIYSSQSSVMGGEPGIEATLAKGSVVAARRPVLAKMPVLLAA